VPFLIAHGTEVFAVLLVLGAALGSWLAARRHGRRRQAQLTTSRDSFGEELREPAEGLGVVRGTVTGDGEILARRVHRRLRNGDHAVDENSQSEAVRIETSLLGEVAIVGSLQVEAGSLEHLDRRGDVAIQQLAAGTEVVARGKLERRGEGEAEYRSPAARWVIRGAHVAALRTTVLPSPAARFFGAITGLALTMGAVAITGELVEDVGEDSSDEIPLGTQVQCAAGPWHREDCLRRARWWLTEHLEDGPEHDATLLAIAGELDQGPSDVAYRIARAGRPEVAEGLLDDTPPDHVVWTIVEGYIARGDFENASRVAERASAERRENYLVLHLLAGERERALRALDAETCLARYLAGDLGPSVRQRPASPDEATCSVLRAESRGTTIPSDAAPWPLGRAAHYLRAVAMRESGETGELRSERSAASTALGHGLWTYEAIPALATRAARELAGTERPELLRVRADALGELAIFDMLTLHLDEAEARLEEMDAAVEAFAERHVPTPDVVHAATPEVLRSHHRALVAVLAVLRGDVARGRRLSEGTSVEDTIALFDPEVGADALARRGMLNADVRRALDAPQDLFTTLDAVAVVVRGGTLTESTLRRSRESTYNTGLSPHYVVRGLHESWLVLREAGEETSRQEALLTAFREALLDEDLALALLAAAHR